MGWGLASPAVKIAVVVTILVAATVVLLIFTMVQQAKVSCEVCIAFHGRTQCRGAAGPTRDDAIKTATDNACGFLASGMANSIACSKTPPHDVVCDGDD